MRNIDRALLAGNSILLLILVGLLVGPRGRIGRPIWERMAKQRAMAVVNSSWSDVVTDAPRLGVGSSLPQLVMFSDFECPACRSTYPAIRDFLSRRPDVAIAYRHFLIPGHPRAAPAARAAACADRLGHFAEYMDLLFSEDSLFLAGAWSSVALRAGITDTAGFAACTADPRIDAVIEADASLAARLSINATPTFWSRRGVALGTKAVEEFPLLLGEGGVEQLESR